MGIRLVTFAAQTVTPQDDALVYEKALQQSGMIYGGTVTTKSANVLHVAEGHGALCGRKFTIEETDIQVPLTPSGSLLGRVYIHMDLSDTGQPISFQVQTANSLSPVIQQTDVNINNGVYEINMATFDVDTSTISNLVNVAPFISVAADPEFSKTKTSPVQNKVITKALGDPETIGGAASKAYSIGDLLLAKDGQLYSVTANIAQGGTISNGGNVTSTGNVISQISNFAQYFKYSTSEYFTGKYWIDGKKIYGKVVVFGALPNANTKSVAHGISNLSAIISLSGIVTAGSSYFILSMVSTVNAPANSALYADRSNVIITSGVDRSSLTATVIMEYTKT